MADLKNHLKSLISEGNLDDVFAALRTCFPDGSGNGNAVIVQQGVWKEANNRLNAGLFSMEDFHKAQDDLVAILKRLIDQIPDADYEKTIAELDLSEIGTISLVNCDRKESYDAFKSFFRQHQTVPFQFYFIVGCPKQEPDSFAERLIYEVIDDVLVGEENAIDFTREKQTIEGISVERVEISNLPMAFDVEKSQLRFKKEFGKRLMRFNMTDVSLEDFVNEKAAQLKYDYFTFLYSLEADKWDIHSTTPYIQWLVNTFKKNKVKQPTFLFYIVVNMDIEKHENIMAEINKIIAQNPDTCGLIDTFKPLQASDLSRWVRERGERSQAKIDDLVKKFSSSLSRDTKLKPDGTMDMTDVEQLQAKIFAYFMKKNS
jgi:hypothetical protein